LSSLCNLIDKMQISQQNQKDLPKVSPLFRQILFQPPPYPLPLRIQNGIKHRMADRAIRQDHVVAEHALLDSAEMGLYFAQAVSRFDGESKSCPTVHAGIPIDSRRAETPSAGLG